MDPFAVIMLGGTGGAVVALLLLGKYYPGNGMDQLDWKPTRSPETEVQNEIDDLDQMLEAANARRRAKGREELSEASIRADLGKELQEKLKSREEYVDDLDLAQMVQRKNERRARKGLPPLTVEGERARIERELEEHGS